LCAFLHASVLPQTLPQQCEKGFLLGYSQISLQMPWPRLRSLLVSNSNARSEFLLLRQPGSLISSVCLSIY
jgi:hypothetical protein